MRNFQPRSEQQNSLSIERKQGFGYEETFGAGAFYDLPNTPNNGLRYSKNYIVFPDRLQPRGGTKQWSVSTLPTLRTGYTATSTVSGNTRTITKTVGTDFAATDYGKYFINDAGVQERIFQYVSTTVIKTYTSSTTEWSCSAGAVRGRVNAKWYHRAQKKFVLFIDTRIYIASDEIMTSWSLAHCESLDILNDAISDIDEYKNWVYIFNSNGIFKLDLSKSTPTYYRVNSPTPSTLITSAGVTANGTRENDKTHGRRYILSGTRLSGVGKRDRNTAGVLIEHETGTTKPDSNYKDWGETYVERPVGVGDTTYGVLTCVALGSSYDTAAEWAAISNGQFKITIDGTEHNCVCNFEGCNSMDEVAAVIQAALRYHFSSATCEYSTDHFVIKNDIESGTVTVTSAGEEGTDISTAMGGATGVVTNVPYHSANIIGTLTIPTHPGSETPEYHDDHFTVWSTMDHAPGAVNPLLDEANDKELYIWNKDIPVARAFSAEVVGYKINLLNDNLLYLEDQGCTIKFADGSTTIISYLCDVSGTRVYTGTSKYAIGDTAGPVLAQAAAIGNGDVFTASIAVSGSETVGNATVTLVGKTISALDERKKIFFADESAVLIVKYLTPATAEVISTAKAGQPATMNPTSRKYCDTVTDYELSTRIAGYSCTHRFRQPLPQSNLGRIHNGFIWVGATHDDYVYYSEIRATYEEWAGYYHPAFQVISLKDSLRAIAECGDSVIVFTSLATKELPTNNFIEREIPQVGESVSVIGSEIDRGYKIGACLRGVVQIDKSRLLVVTSEPAGLNMRIFDGQSYSASLAQDRFLKILRSMQPAFCLSYDDLNGLIMWGLTT